MGLLSNMFPEHLLPYCVNRGCRHHVLFRKYSGWEIRSAHLQNFLLRKLSRMMVFPLERRDFEASPYVSIVSVCCIRSSVQVRPIHAPFIVGSSWTFMTDKVLNRVMSVMEKERHPVSVKPHGLPVLGHAETSVPDIHQWGCPRPALVRPVNIDFRPEASNVGWRKGRDWFTVVSGQVDLLSRSTVLRVAQERYPQAHSTSPWRRNQ